MLENDKFAPKVIQPTLNPVGGKIEGISETQFLRVLALSPKQFGVFEILARQDSSKSMIAVGQELGISPYTAAGHLTLLKEKLGIDDITTIPRLFDAASNSLEQIYATGTHDYYVDKASELKRDDRTINKGDKLDQLLLLRHLVKGKKIKDIAKEEHVTVRVVKRSMYEAGLLQSHSAARTIEAVFRADREGIISFGDLLTIEPEEFGNLDEGEIELLDALVDNDGRESSNAQIATKIGKREQSVKNMLVRITKKIPSSRVQLAVNYAYYSGRKV